MGGRIETFKLTTLLGNQKRVSRTYLVIVDTNNQIHRYEISETFLSVSVEIHAGLKEFYRSMAIDGLAGNH